MEERSGQGDRYFRSERKLTLHEYLLGWGPPPSRLCTRHALSTT